MESVGESSKSTIDRTENCSYKASNGGKDNLRQVDQVLYPQETIEPNKQLIN